MEYNYPLDYTWSTEEIIDVIGLYNAVEKAYEGGISKKEFMEAYRKFKLINSFHFSRSVPVLPAVPGPPAQNRAQIYYFFLINEAPP